MQPKSFYFKKSLIGANYQIYINFINERNEVKSYPVLDLPAGLELNKEYSFESSFDNFNKYFSKMVNDYKPLYAIAFYEMYDFKSLTGIVGDNYDEIKKIYDEKYAWKRDEIGVTEYNYRIIKIDIKDVLEKDNTDNEDYKKKYEELKKEYNKLKKECVTLQERYDLFLESMR